jgi:hypothetical protein
MYNNQIFYVVTEANVLSNDTIGTQTYTYVPNYANPDLTKQQAEDAAKADAQNKLYRLWAYGAKPDEGETRQLFSASMTEYRGNQIIMLESKVFDYRQPEPAPEPEPEPEES